MSYEIAKAWATRLNVKYPDMVHKVLPRPGIEKGHQMVVFFENGSSFGLGSYKISLSAVDGFWLHGQHDDAEFPPLKIKLSEIEYVAMKSDLDK